MLLFRKYSRQHLISTVLLCLLLVAAVLLSCIATVSCKVTNTQLADLEKNHTTIALVNGLTPEEFTESYHSKGAIDMRASDGGITWGDGGWVPNADTLYRTGIQAPQTLYRESSGLLAAYLQNGMGISANIMGQAQYDSQWDTATTFCVLAVHCTGVQEANTPLGSRHGAINKGPYGMDFLPAIMGYKASFEIIDTVSTLPMDRSLAGEQLLIDEVRGIYTAKGEIPFEKGKTYLLRGFCVAPEYMQVGDQEGNLTLMPTQGEGEFLFEFTREELNGVFLNDGTENFILKTGQIGGPPDLLDQADILSGKTDWEYLLYSCPSDNTLPFYTEYTGFWQDYLNSLEGTLWKETIVPWANANSHSVQVVLTNNVMSTYNFNTGIATVLDGRLITDEEYAAGADVCLVSTVLADANNWEVGDLVSVDFYTTNIYSIVISKPDASDPDSYKIHMGQSWLRSILQPENRIGLNKEYTIVGIYTAPEFSPGLQNFTAETIFVPKASIPDVSQYENEKVNYCNALVLQNGAEDAFEAYMAEQGMGGYFTYCDQNYSAVHSAYTAMAATANRLAMIGSCVLALAAAAYHLLFLHRLAPTVRSARLIGVSAAKVGYQLIITLLLHTGVSVVLGTVLAFALYGTVTGRLLGELSMHTPTLFHTAAIILIALIVIGVAAAMSASRIDLMRQAKGKRKKGSAHPAAVSAQLASCTSFSLSVAAGEQQLIAQRSTSVPAFTVASVFTPGLQSMTLRGLARRRTTALMLATLALAGVLGAALLLWQIDRQQYEWELGQTNFTVHCTVTNPQGGSQQSLNMTANELYELINGPLTPHIKNVSATATEVLTAPQKYSVRRITNLSADESITRLAGATVSLLTGWDESVFATTQPVCLVPAGTAVATDDTGASYITVQDIGGTPTRLQVIGVVTGGPQNALHIPMFLPLDGTDALPDIVVDSCGFDIADTSRLEESRAALYGSFCDPRDITTHSAGDYGLLINDEIFQTARAGVESSIALFRMLLPLLVAGMGLIGFLATTLAAAGRRREFAVMRCMGICRRTIAALVLEELLLCALTGTALALAAALALPGAFTPAMWLATGAVLLVFVLGGVAAALHITAVDVIKLMKVEE